MSYYKLVFLITQTLFMAALFFKRPANGFNLLRSTVRVAPRSTYALSKRVKLSQSDPICVPTHFHLTGGLHGVSSSRLFSTEGGGEDTVVDICRKKIADLLNPVHLKVTSTNDDPNGSHLQIECVSAEFVGKNTLARQRLVYKAIWEEMNGPVHAVDHIIAKTPDEVGM